MFLKFGLQKECNVWLALMYYTSFLSPPPIQLLLKLQNKSTQDLPNEVLHLLYLEHITHSYSKLAGYYFLHALLNHASDSTSFVLAPLPHFSDSVDPIHFAASLISRPLYLWTIPQIPQITYLWIHRRIYLWLFVDFYDRH